MTTEGPNRYFRDIEEFVKVLSHAGFSLVRYSEEPRAFDNLYADFSNGQTTFRVVRDRSQWMVDGEKQLLERYGLWKAFDDQQEFESALFRFAKEQV